MTSNHKIDLDSPINNIHMGRIMWIVNVDAIKLLISRAMDRWEWMAIEGNERKSSSFFIFANSTDNK